MEDFLRKLQLSEHSIEIYLKTLGKFPLTYYELYSIVPKASLDEFEESLNQLVNGGLLIQLPPKKPEILMHYFTIPPILPVLNYYENIDVNLSTIKNSIQELMISSINQIFKRDETIKLDEILDTFQEFKKDIEEDDIIQKQEIEDIVEGMEDLKKIREEISTLWQQIKTITQTEFASLLKTMTKIKTDIVKDIEALEFKKYKKEILSIVEQIFKKELDKVVKDFSNNLYEIIEQKFEETNNKTDKIMEEIFQYRNDFKMVLLNMLNNFETKMNSIQELLKENEEDLFANMKNLEIKVAESLNEVIQSSINEVAGLNKPIENVMKKYFHEIISTDKLVINNIWIINSITKINEEIQKFIATSQENLTIIVPKLENHLAIEQFENLSRNLKIRLASSEPHTNSLVKEFKTISTLTYKNFENYNLIALKGDDDQVAIGVIQSDATEPLNNFIGIACNAKPLVELLDPVVQNIWEEAYLDTFYASQKAKAPTSPTLKTIKPITSPKSQLEAIMPKEFQEVTTPKIKEVPSKTLETTPSSPPKLKEQITELTQKLQEKIKFSPTTAPKAGDEAAILINNAFNNLIQKLDGFKGEDFSRELQKVADLVLENVGFSVTLHRLRSMINKYKEKDSILEEQDKNEIKEEIEVWKKKLL